MVIVFSLSPSVDPIPQHPKGDPVQKTIHVVGSINEDLRVLVDHQVRVGETISADGGDTELGGKGANQAIAASRAGGQVRFVGSVGTDAVGDWALATLQAEGIDTESISRHDHIPTGKAIVSIDRDGDNAIIVIPGANAQTTPEQIRHSLRTMRRSDIVLCQLEIPVPAITEASRLSQAAGAYLIVNAAPFRTDILDLLDQIDLLVVNESELEALRDQLGARRDEATIARNHDLDLLVTRGGDPSQLIGRSGQHINVPSRSVEPVDTTAAGDTYIGYLAAALSRGTSVEQAMTVAASAAALAVTRPGAARSIPRAAEVDQLPELGQIQRT